MTAESPPHARYTRKSLSGVTNVTFVTNMESDLYHSLERSTSLAYEENGKDNILKDIFNLAIEEGDVHPYAAYRRIVKLRSGVVDWAIV